jgi:hypothetical protein
MRKTHAETQYRTSFLDKVSDWWMNDFGYKATLLKIQLASTLTGLTGSTVSDSWENCGVADKPSHIITSLFEYL